MLVGLVLLVGLGLATLGAARGSRVRWTTGVVALALPAALIGLGFLCFALFGAAFWHFGGREHDPIAGDGYFCAAWWNEIGARHGVSQDLAAAPYCHDRAVDAVPSVVAAGGTVGLGTAGASALVLVLRRRRFDAGLRALVTGS